MFHGSMVALVTPMHEDGAVDRGAFERLIEFHIDHGTDAVVVAGTTGESPTLSQEEHCELIRYAVDCARGRIPIIGGTGSNATREAIELTRCAMEAGADACLLVTPYYNKPTQEGLYRHFKAVADAVPVPQILYNVPGRTGCDIKPETVGRLASVSNIVGIKEATGDPQRTQDLVAVCGDRIDIYSGEDPAALELMLAGGKGVISVTANCTPRLMHNMSAAAVAGQESQARELNNRLEPLHRALFLESNPIAVKWALYEMGLIPRGIRLPLTVLSEQYHETMRTALRQAGALD